MNQIMNRCTKYLDIARSTKAFNEAELDVLSELLEECLEGSDEEGYMLIGEKVGNDDVAFLIYGKTPMTEFTYDLYWIVVSPSYQGKGIGRRLVSRMEESVLKEKDKANIRVETSGKEDYAQPRAFYNALGFRECGRIPSFYREGDDLVTFYKAIIKNDPSGGKEKNDKL